MLATDQSTESVTDEEGNTVVKAFRTVTLEVTPSFAERVAVAQTMGSLSLSLRSIADNQAELERAIANGEINIPEGATPEEEERILRDAMARPIVGQQTYETAFAISRFRRAIQAKDEAVIDERVRSQQAAYQGGSSGDRPAQAPAGPSVRVTRGKNTTAVPVSGGQQAAADALLRGQASNVRGAGKTVPAASAPLVR